MTKWAYEGSLRATNHRGNSENRVGAASQQSKPIVRRQKGIECVRKMTAQMGETSHRKRQEEEAMTSEMKKWRGRQAQWWSIVHKMDLYERPRSWKDYNSVVASYKQWEEAQA